MSPTEEQTGQQTAETPSAPPLDAKYAVLLKRIAEWEASLTPVEKEMAKALGWMQQGAA
jgi:hypothetical protein